jgi:methylmalonyl-CoA mutase cobalamin-binding domain/chain
MALAKEKGLDKNKLVLFGGVIPVEDAKTMREIGVNEVFMPEQKIAEVADYIKNSVKNQKGGDKV